MMKRILIVDDDEAILEVIEIILRERGYDVSVVSDSQGIYRVIQAKHPHLILLDIWMAGIDGSEIARTLKQNPQTQTIPIIMISANNEGAKLARESGADAFLAKPFELEDLVRTVSHHLSH